jgi:hypothetical protein
VGTFFAAALIKADVNRIKCVRKSKRIINRSFWQNS